VERICIIWLICTLFNHSSLSAFTVIFPVSTLLLDKSGDDKNIFKRTLNTVPSINADCFLLQGDDLSKFMNIILLLFLRYLQLSKIYQNQYHQL
jgi:hypothetical protein